MLGSRKAGNTRFAAKDTGRATGGQGGAGVYAAEDVEAETARLSRDFGLLAAPGAVLVIAGLVGLVRVCFATLTSMILFGWLLLVGGAIGLLHAVQARGTKPAAAADVSWAWSPSGSRRVSGRERERAGPAMNPYNPNSSESGIPRTGAVIGLSDADTMNPKVIDTR